MRILKLRYICNRIMRGGALAQLVEQWTENPCVPGSIPGGTTSKAHLFKWAFLYLIATLCISIILFHICKILIAIKRA